MSKIRTIVSSTALLSVGGLGVKSYDGLLRPNDMIVAETYIGMDGVAYETKEEASKTFIEEMNYKYDFDGELYDDADDYYAQQHWRIEYFYGYHIGGYHYATIEDVLMYNPITEYLMYGDNYIKADEQYKYLFDYAASMIEETTMDVYRAPTVGWSYVSDGWEETETIHVTVKMDKLTSTYDQDMFDLSNHTGYKFILPTDNNSETDVFNSTKTSKCSTTNMTMTFKNGTVKCNTFDVVDRKTVYKDKETLEYSTSKSELIAKKIDQLTHEYVERYKFLDVFYESHNQIEDYIREQLGTWYMWNGNYHLNRDVLDSTIKNHFEQNKEENKLEYSANVCSREEPVAIEYLYDWLIANYDSLVNECT